MKVEVDPLEIRDETVEVLERADELDELPGIIIT